MPAYNNNNNNSKKKTQQQTKQAKQNKTKKESKQKHGAEYSRILNVSEAVHSTRSLYKLLSSYRDRDVFRTLSNINDGAFCKKNNT